jgi:hypothetical protein
LPNETTETRVRGQAKLAPNSARFPSFRDFVYAARLGRRPSDHLLRDLRLAHGEQPGNFATFAELREFLVRNNASPECLKAAKSLYRRFARWQATR